MPESRDFRVVVLISANVEWRVIRDMFSDVELFTSPFGEWFVVNLIVGGQDELVAFVHGGWGKISAAASTQYVIDRWAPELLVNLGTCGGLEGEIAKGEILLVDRVVVYDIFEQIGDHDEHIAHYTTDLDLSWLGESYPQEVLRTLIVSGDRDLMVEDIPRLKAEFGAVAGDWESGAIAWVASRNDTRCLILRGVSDLVGTAGGEAYEGNIVVFEEGASELLQRMVRCLPAWIAAAL